MDDKEKGPFSWKALRNLKLKLGVNDGEVLSKKGAHMIMMDPGKLKLSAKIANLEKALLNSKKSKRQKIILIILITQKILMKVHLK